LTDQSNLSHQARCVFQEQSSSNFRPGEIATYFKTTVQQRSNHYVLPFLHLRIIGTQFLILLKTKIFSILKKKYFKNIPYILHIKLKDLTLSNSIFLPTAYSPGLICFGRERGWWDACNYPTVLKEKIIEKQKEYNLHFLLAKVRTT
jgi:hypothetical protein